MSKSFAYFCSWNFSFLIATLRTAFSPCRLINMLSTPFIVYVWNRTELKKYPNLEGTHKDQVQLLDPHRTFQKLNPLSESIAQTLPKLQQLAFTISALGWTDLGNSDAPHTPCPLVSSPSSQPSFGCSSVVLCLPDIMAPKQHTVLELRMRRTEQSGTIPFPGPVGCSGHALQDVVGSFGCQSKLLTQIQLALNHNPRVPFSRAALQILSPHSAHSSRVAQVKNLAFAVEFHVIGDSPAFQCFKLSLQDLLTLEEVNSFS